PRASDRILPCSSARRHTVFVPPASIPSTSIVCYVTTHRGPHLDRLPRHRRLSAGRHPVRIVFPPLPADDARLPPHGPVGAVVGDLLHHRRNRNQHAHLHQRTGDGVRERHDVPAARLRVRHRPGAREHAVHPGVLSRRSADVVRIAPTPFRAA